MNKNISSKKTVFWQYPNIVQTVIVSKQKAKELGNRQYQQAMKHMKKFNQYQADKSVKVEPLDIQCTFKPRLYTQSYKGFAKPIIPKTLRNHKKPQERLLDWGKATNNKKIQNILNNSLQIQTKLKANLTQSVQKRKQPKTYTQKYLLSKTITMSQIPSPIKKNSYANSLGYKQNSQATLFTTSHVRSRTSLLS